MPVSLKSTGGGSVTLDVPATGSTFTLTLPAATGTVATTTGTLTNPTINGFTGDTSVINVGSGQFYKDTSGNVGVGTSSPGAKLEIATTNQSMKITGSGAANWTTVANTSRSFNYGVDATGFNIYDNTAASYRMIINSSGNMGIGGTPSADTTYKWLTITGPTTSGGGIVQLNNSDSSVGINMFCNNLAGYVGTSTAHPLLFRINSSEVARIDSSGNLLVGKTSTANNIPGLILYGQATTVNYGRIDFLKTASGTKTAQEFDYNGSGVGSITYSDSATAFNTSSDYRLKHDVQPMVSGLSVVSSLNPVTYKWNVDDSNGEGFIAHELAEVIPLAVTGEKDAVNEDGKPIYQGVDYSKIVVHLVAACQELSAKNDALEARLALLESK